MQAFGVRRCPHCSAEIREHWRVCPACETRLTSPGSETKTALTAASTPVSTGIGEGRFPAGTVLAGRYRVMGLIGKGGMGEVYRAHDLILSQQVALKFL